ncbi:MAG: stage 0 sporulation family protein [Chloroflexota bacterium]
MPTVIGIRFKDSGKTYFFDPNNLTDLNQGDHVIVDTVRGPELAKVAYPPREVPQEEIVGELKPVLRRAEPADFERMRLLNARHDEVMARCAEKIREHGLPMRLVKAEYSFDGSRLTFYFTAEKRVDFRMLVRDLARTFRTRIELRQIGPRDEAKLLGGIGPCGRLLCCATFLPDYARVSIKMAKDQDLPLNPTKISGVCGRLLCCLSYEHEQYVQIKGSLPKKGTWVQTPDGPGEVVSVNVLKETVMVALAGSGIHEEFSPSQLSEATDRVAALARSRNEEGITPAARGLLRGLEDERGGRAGRRQQKGERRLLREEIDNPDVLDALALLEEGFEDYEPPDTPAAPRPQPERQQPPQLKMPRPAPEGPPQSRQQRQGGGQQPRPERPAPAESAPQQPEDHAQPTSPSPSSPRRRRRRGRDRGG